jgi:hypothetical protein
VCGFSLIGARFSSPHRSPRFMEHVPARKVVLVASEGMVDGRGERGERGEGTDGWKGLCSLQSCRAMVGARRTSNSFLWRVPEMVGGWEVVMMRLVGRGEGVKLWRAQVGSGWGSCRCVRARMC